VAKTEQQHREDHERGEHTVPPWDWRTDEPAPCPLCRKAGWGGPSPRYERLCALVRELADAADASVSEVWDAYDKGELTLVRKG